MEGFATGAAHFKHGGKREMEWARKWHRHAAPIMARLGFNAGAFRPCLSTLPDRPGDPGSGAAGQRGSVQGFASPFKTWQKIKRKMQREGGLEG